jgi:hypothetical protein
MCLEMIRLPLRIAASATRLGVRLTEQAAGVALGVTRRLIEAAGPGEPPGPAAGGGGESGGLRVDVVIASSPSTSETASDRPSAQDATDAARGPEARTPPTRPQAPAAEASSSAPTSLSSPAPATRPPAASPPRRVSEEVQFVEAFAEPGAEEGAGAEVHVREPWNGYARMTANEVIARLAEASREEVAAVMLYERAHRRRQTVLAAAERQLRLAMVGPPRQRGPAVDGSRQTESADSAPHVSGGGRA